MSPFINSLGADTHIHAHMTHMTQTHRHTQTHKYTHIRMHTCTHTDVVDKVML